MRLPGADLTNNGSLNLIAMLRKVVVTTKNRGNYLCLPRELSLEPTGHPSRPL